MKRINNDHLTLKVMVDLLCLRKSSVLKVNFLERVMLSLGHRAEGFIKILLKRATGGSTGFFLFF